MHAELDMSDASPSAFQSSFIALAIDRILRGAVTIVTFKSATAAQKPILAF
jgi:hypothetical protein